jgi:hypothetical protein
VWYNKFLSTKEQAMSFMREAVREWVWIVGQDRSDQQWILSSYDTWERNPHYTGADQPHPEDEYYGDEE